MIIRGGENIQPLEIEDFVRKKSEVEDCYVVGVPSLRLALNKTNRLVVIINYYKTTI